MMSLRSDQTDFMSGLKGRLLVDEPMSKHTTWRVGGKAEYFYTPADETDLIRLLHQLPGEMPVHWIGLGSNILVRDGGIKGMVIRTSKGIVGFEKLGEDLVYIESGVACAQVARKTLSLGLSGVEFLAGVPGSFGGALAMNAGAFGGETWDWVDSIRCVNRFGECTEYQAADIEYGYRHVRLPENSWVLGGRLKLNIVDNASGGKHTIRSLLEKRSETQPVQSANAGSVFRNPEKGYAAKMIESCGLKGLVVGGAGISQLHANFIVNDGSACAEDIESLITIIQKEVEAKLGVCLEPEVRIIGGKL